MLVMYSRRPWKYFSSVSTLMPLADAWAELEVAQVLSGERFAHAVREWIAGQDAGSDRP